MRNSFFPAFATASPFSSIPPTGPMLPSGFIIPVMATLSFKFIPSSKARVATVIVAPADGPPTMGESELI